MHARGAEGSIRLQTPIDPRGPALDLEDGYSKF
jgi:hypothetical protein